MANEDRVIRIAKVSVRILLFFILESSVVCYVWEGGSHLKLIKSYDAILLVQRTYYKQTHQTKRATCSIMPILLFYVDSA